MHLLNSLQSVYPNIPPIQESLHECHYEQQQQQQKKKKLGDSVFEIEKGDVTNN